MFNINITKKVNNEYICNIKKIITSKLIDVLLIFALAIIICICLHIFGGEHLSNKLLSDSWLLFLIAPTIISMFYIGSVMRIIFKRDIQYNKIDSDFDYAEIIIEHILQNPNAMLREILFLQQENLISADEFRNKINLYLNSKQAVSYDELISLIGLKHKLNLPDEKLLSKKQYFLTSAEYVSKQKLEHLAQLIRFDHDEFNLKLRSSKFFLLRSSVIRLVKLSMTLLSMILYIMLYTSLRSHNH